MVTLIHMNELGPGVVDYQEPVPDGRFRHGNRRLFGLVPTVSAWPGTTVPNPAQSETIVVSSVLFRSCIAILLVRQRKKGRLDVRQLNLFMGQFFPSPLHEPPRRPSARRD